MTALRRPVAGCLVALVAAVAGLVTPVGAATPACAAADQPHHVAIVVEHGDGTIVTACVGFATDAISGIDALASSGIEYGTVGFGGFGQAVCQLDGEPATYPPSCFTSGGSSWALFVARNGSPWALSSVGVSSLSLHDGDEEGFRYDPQSGTSAPPSTTGHCPSATSGPTPRATASLSAPTPRATSAAATVAAATPRPPGGGQPSGTPPATVVPPTAASSASASPVSASPTANGSPVVASPVVLSPSTGKGSSPGSGAIPIAGAALVVLAITGVSLARRRRGSGGRAGGRPDGPPGGP
ncbi:MAG: hypothetical protein ACYDCI_00760 [Candidatus Limnocylindrales bacterium]